MALQVSRPLSGFECGTKLITNKGLQRFADFHEEEPVQVLGMHGSWTNGIVRHLDAQEIWESIIERCRVQHTIRTTGDHLWLVTSPLRRFRNSQPKFLRTDELEQISGSSTYKLMTVNPADIVGMDHDGILHGITYGDGTKHKSYKGRKEFCQIYLCNDEGGVDSRELAGLFEQAGYKLTIRDDLAQVRIYALPKHWKELPSLENGPDYLKGFIAGWVAADGHVNLRGGNVIISSANDASLEWLQQIAPVAGIATSTKMAKHQTISTFGPTTWYSLSLSKESLDSEFFLLDEKRRRFGTAKFSKYWKIVSVKPTGNIVPVSCIEVPDGGQFVLEGNILTCGHVALPTSPMKSSTSSNGCGSTRTRSAA